MKMTMRELRALIIENINDVKIDQSNPDYVIFSTDHGIATLNTGYPKMFVVDSIKVDANQRRKGIATTLYRAMYKFAIKHGSRLGSDYQRSPDAEAIWQKFVADGKARCVKTNEPGQNITEPGHTWPCTRFVMINEP